VREFIARHLSRRARVAARVIWWGVCTGEVVSNIVGRDALYAAVWSALWVFEFVDWSQRLGAWRE